MNDFTKEELEEIVDMMHYARKQGIDTTHNLSYQVELKAKSMIDSYCEHTYVARTAPHAHGAKEIGAVVQCSKCGEPPRTTNE